MIIKKAKADKSLETKLNHILMTVLLLACSIVAIMLASMIMYNLQHSSISSNIIRASQFNQDFKEEVDLKMYYYVIDSNYADGLPLDAVETAKALAKSLLEDTENRESHKAITSVLSLCSNLEDKINEIAQTQGYDERVEQLETNIYILTELIQQYMYNYLYHEAGHLAQLQQDLNHYLILESVLVAAVTLVLIILVLRKSMAISRSITQPIDALCQRAEDIGKGDLQAKAPIIAEDKALQTLSESFENMAERLNYHMELNRQEQERMRAMELALLQSQINPHFLYNTLDTIIWLIETGKSVQAVNMVSSLSSFFRTSLSKGRDVITMQEEELHAKSYLEIQQVRYKDILTYSIDIAPELAGCPVPKLTIQPLVENALYHGIKLKRGMGTIDVRGKYEGDMVVLTVRDNGAGMTAERLQQLRDSVGQAEQSVGFGLAAVYKRLQLLMGSECKMEIESTPGEGTAVTLKFTWQKENDA